MPKGNPFAGKNAQGGKFSPVIGDNGLKHLSKQEISAITSHNLHFLKMGMNVDKNNIAQLENNFIQYIQYCQDNNVKPGNLAAYMAIGIDKTNAYDWENGSRGPEYSHFIKKVKYFCGAIRESLAADSKINPVLAIFWQKNYDGLTDVQHNVLIGGNPLGEMADAKRLEAHFHDSLPDDE